MTTADSMSAGRPPTHVPGTDDTADVLDRVERPMERLFEYLRPKRGRLTLAVLASVVNKVLDLAPPFLVAWLVDVCARKPAPWIVDIAGTELPHQLDGGNLVGICRDEDHSFELISKGVGDYV